MNNTSTINTRTALYIELSRTNETLDSANILHSIEIDNFASYNNALQSSIHLFNLIHSGTLFIEI